MNRQLENLRVQKWVVGIALLLFVIKVIAYWLTHSVAILTDALESTVNVVAGFIGLYSLYVASKPRDFEHPYGHGKAEFLSAAVEGTLILVAGIIIIYEAIYHLLHPQPLRELDYGILLVAVTALINFITGYISIRKGRKNNSLALLASGKHLQSDTWSTLGIIAGLAILYLTGKTWLDSAIAMVFALIIIVTGYRIIRSSVAGIMDEADRSLLSRLVQLLNEKRRPNWVDLHNLRVIKYGSTLHLDCHLTLPWYLNLHQAHEEVEALGKLIRADFGDAIELFVHTDGCLDFSCPICPKTDCQVRRHEYQDRINWTLENIISNEKHRLQGRDKAPSVSKQEAGIQKN